ncbi:MAG TPA: YcxB family protein [Noviherbaspirillum sp.]|uniref:YcxB family protein n=1 Tax=Noviherbaspirillum sp. TaxID=1926288 RepID=UPI002DDD2BB3|nr:YcxB family protein [Noviherbaspirillum sp.]HEV2612568.1 YcxB family protein [Noviherbaspirillum sp.]
MITGVVSEKNYLDAYRLHRRPVAIAVNWTAGLVAMLGFVLTVLGVKPWGIVLAFGGIGGLIGEAIQSYLYLPRKVRKLYSQYKGIDAPITYRWDSKRFSVHSDRGNGDRNWESLVKVRENNELFLLYTTDALFEVVPKAWFNSTAQATEFYHYAQGKV